MPRIFLLIALVFSLNVFSQSADKETLDVLSWNIYMLPGITNIAKSVQKSNKRERAHQIATLINESKYDIVVFQESFFAPARRKLKKDLNQNFPYQYGPVNPSGLGYKTSSGILIVSKMPLKLLGKTQFRTCNGVDCIAKKGAGLFEGEWQGNRFQILGTHLNAGGPAWIREEQFKQMYEELLLPHSKLGVPQIICGDMNTHKEAMEDYANMLGILKAEDTPTYGDQVNTTVKDRTVIDYILLRRNKTLIRVVDKQVKRFMASGEVIDRLGGTLSDHLAVDISIEF